MIEKAKYNHVIMYSFDIIQTSITTRDIAISFWVLVVLIILHIKADIRSDIFDLTKKIFSNYILLIFLIIALYIIFICYLLYKFGVWDLRHLKLTVFWFFGVAILSVFRLNSVKEDSPYVKNSLIDSIKLIAVIEFIVNFHTFSIFIELILVPLLAIIGIMIAFAERKPETVKLANTLNYFLAFYVLTIGLLSLRDIFTEKDSYFYVQIFNEFIIPIILTTCVSSGVKTL